MSQNNTGIEPARNNFKYEVVSRSYAIKRSILPKTKQKSNPNPSLRNNLFHGLQLAPSGMLESGDQIHQVPAYNNNS